jgi:hypothetical protein
MPSCPSIICFAVESLEVKRHAGIRTESLAASVAIKSTTTLPRGFAGPGADSIPESVFNKRALFA